ncbi:glycosyltransferase [Syntrophotalea acetylenica]|uniref:glycosyltransferase n=1 Tax=Syntrophotalea acetylenica TaxID=29542 RepID=UPI0009FB3D09|nr:glycosyltransferase [Syntrophotalea acetylenica]
MLYRKANHVVAVSSGVKESLLKYVKGILVHVIYNPLELNLIRKLSEEKLNCDLGKYIVGVGRLHRQKGFDLLIKAFSLVGDHELKLVLVGEGEEKKKLYNLCVELGVEDRVLFKGFSRNPYKYMRNAKCFVLSSRWEGFGLVLAEALASKTKVVAFNCKSGPSEILDNGKYGILVEPGNVNQLSKCIAKLIYEDTSITILDNENAVSRFDMYKVVGQYAKLLIS